MRLSRTATDNSASPSGIPVCVSATLMDGVVFALTPNHHGCNYRSAVVFGQAHVVVDEP
jgi:nitroimidazol reductase NimA-like FMN-containing flavoprotein (pyridoxamine 5'-phosphate oxidase superfamily)